MFNAPQMFETKLDANAWLAAQVRASEAGTWEPPVGKSPTRLEAFATEWLATRELKPTTRKDYGRLLDRLIVPALGKVELTKITPQTVRSWYAALDAKTPVTRARAYGLLRTIFTTAVQEDLLPANPCRIRGAGVAKKAHTTKVATLDELAVIVERMPDRYRAMVLLAAWCGLRFGELAELRRADLDLVRQVINVERGVTRVDGLMIVGTPKTDAGTRRVTLPPHLVPSLVAHLAEHVGDSPGALLFPSAEGGRHLQPSTLYKVFYPAREKAGRPDLRFHDLRHTGATLAAATGAMLADLMHRLGHTTPAAAMRYQHAAADRDRDIAAALSGFATAGQVTLKAVK